MIINRGFLAQKIEKFPCWLHKLSVVLNGVKNIQTAAYNGAHRVSSYLRQNQENFSLKVCWLYSRSAEGGIASGMKDS